MTNSILYKDKPWLTRYDTDVPESLTYEEVCLPEFLKRSSAKFPQRMALLFEGYRLTYRQLDQMVDQCALALTQVGIKKGTSVAILLPNLIPCVVAYYATLKIGAICVMNNPLYSDRELEHQFNDSKSRIIITLDLLVKRMVALRPKTSVKQIIYTSIGDYLPFPKNLLFPLIGPKKKLSTKVTPASEVYKWKEFLKFGTESPPEISLSFEDVAMYQYTGGTTGISKGVILTHGNLSKQIQQISAWFPPFDKNGIMTGALPFFHVFGLSCSMNLAIYRSWGNVLIPKPQPDHLLKAINKFKPTFAPLVPTMYIGMLNHSNMDKTDITSIKGCFSGSASMPQEVIKAFEEKTGTTIVEGYGLTETCPVTHINPFNGKRKMGSIGLPITDTKARIVSLTDGTTDMPVGEIGELLIKGPQVMQGYWKQPKATLKALSSDGWLHTGDIAKMDEEGYFYIVDRKKDMIISSGYNVYPRDIEEVFFGHPKVMEVCAIGIAHPTRGEAVKLFAVLKKGESATKEELLEYCKDKLAKYKWPEEIEFRKELPKSTVGKVLKKDLRKKVMKK
jgi:long-chain acyl-CoA synthetase